MNGENTNPGVLNPLLTSGVSQGQCEDRMKTQTKEICTKIDTLRAPVVKLMDAFTEEKGRQAGLAEARKASVGKLNLNARLIGLVLGIITSLVLATLWISSRLPDPEVQAMARIEATAEQTKAIVKAIKEMP